MSALLDYIEEQQDIAEQLCMVLEVIDALHDADIDRRACEGLIFIARDMAQRLDANLCGEKLPKGGEA